jgi:hypothetical protein
MTTITIYAPGYWDYLDSYGLLACQLTRGLTQLGIHVNAVGLGGRVMENQPSDVRTVTSRPIRPSLGGIVLGYPTGYGYHSELLYHGPRIALTMFESTKLPPGWVEPLNEMDAVITPSNFCAEVFRQCGVTSPIHVIPLGINSEYIYAERPVDAKTACPLTFLSFLDRGSRKGGIVSLQAFITAFGDDPNYKLILKGRQRKHRLNLLNSNVEVIQEDLDDLELLDLYLQADILINPHKGEGFGLIPREFAATGGIALTTAWSGTADDLSDWGWPLPYALEPADWEGERKLQGQDLGEWAVPDKKQLVVILKEVAENIDFYRTKAITHAYNVRRLYSWPLFAERVLAVWEEINYGYRTRMAAA